MWRTLLILFSLIHAGWCSYGSSCEDGTCESGMVCMDNICKCDNTTHEVYIHFEDRHNSSLAECREKDRCNGATECKQGRCQKTGDLLESRCTCPQDNIYIKEKNGEVNGCWKNMRRNVSKACSSIGKNCDVDKRLLCVDGKCQCDIGEVFFGNRCITVKEYSKATGNVGYIASENMYCTSEFECDSDTQRNLTCTSYFCTRNSASSVASMCLFLIIVSIGLASCTSNILVF